MSERVKPVVVCAACKYGPVLICGARHWDSVMRQQYEQTNWPKLGSDILKPPTGEFKQGFINQFGEFLTREEALQVAKEAEQFIDYDRNCSVTLLYSEGLY